MIKVKFMREIHIIRVENDIEGVKRAVRNVFKLLPQHFHFTYMDQDGDHIVVDCQNDFKVLINNQQSSVKGRLKLQVVQTLKPEEEMGQGIQLLGDGESSVEYLEEGQQSKLFLDDYEGNCGQQQLFQSIQYEQPEYSVLVSEQAQGNKTKIEQEIYEEFINNSLIEDQVNAYLQNLYIDIQRKTIQSEEIKDKQREAEITGMIQRSLSKLLPQFMKKVSQQTTKTVKKLMKQQRFI